MMLKRHHHFASQRFQDFSSFVQYKWDIKWWVRKRIHYSSEGGIEKSVPRNHRLSSLRKACDANRWSPIIMDSYSHRLPSQFRRKRTSAWCFTVPQRTEMMRKRDYQGRLLSVFWKAIATNPYKEFAPKTPMRWRIVTHRKNPSNVLKKYAKAGNMPFYMELNGTY